MENGDVKGPTVAENQENIKPGNEIDIKVTPVIKLVQEEGNLTPVSSAGEDDDSPDFQDMLKQDKTWIPPSEEIEIKIRDLLEHYFSNDNISKDKFLLKHVKRNKHGYVSVKLLTSFKKIKNLSKDWKMTAYCVLKSDKLEINRVGTKLRRKEPLPEIDLPTTSIRTILYKLGDSQEEPSVDQVSEKFREFGQLTTIRIIRPSMEVPADLRNHMTKHPELGQSLCVVIEFETTDGAHNAYKTLSKVAREEEKTESYSLLGSGRNPRKTGGRNRDIYDSNDESPYTSSRENSPLMPRRKFVTGKNGWQTNTRYSVSPLASPQGSRDTSPTRSNSDRSPRGSPRMQRKNLGGQASIPPPSGSWRTGLRDSTPETSPRGSPKGSPMSSRKHISQQKKSPLAIPNNVTTPDSAGSNNSTPSGSPWLQRKRMLAASQAANSPSGSPGTSPVLGRKFQDGVPEGVLRLPKGPPSINAKGFDSAWKRRVKTASVVKSLNDKPSPLVSNA
ncbi:la-related protein 6-like [Styela clava]